MDFILAPSLFNSCMHWVLCRDVDESQCGVSVSDRITVVYFAAEVVKPLGLQATGQDQGTCVWRLAELNSAV